MTYPTIKMKITPAPKLRGKMDVRFPANVEASAPIILDKSGGTFTFSLDVNSLSAVQSVVAGSNVTVDNTDPRNPVVSASASGTGDFSSNTSSSVDGEVVLFSGTGGKTGKRATGTGIAKLTSGVLGTATSGTDYAPATSGTSILKGNGSGGFSSATAGTDYYNPGGTDVAIADGGTGASTAAAARTNLGSTTVGDAVFIAANAAAARTAIGAVIGTDVQAYDADLAALATNSTNGLWARTGAGTGSARTITGTANAISVTNGDGVSGNPTLAISTDAALPGNPTTTTQAVDNNTTRVATTAYVVGQAAAATPLGNAATAVVGTSTRFARADHVHPGREVLTASRTYYFRSDGSDSNTGLVNSAGGAFLTIQKAIDTVAGLDCSIYDVTIQGGATGTYAPITLKTFLGAGKVTIVGNTTTPANYVIASTSADGVSGSNVLGRYKIEGFKFTNATSGSHIKLYNTYCEVGANDYGAATTAHIWLEQNAYVEATANYTISGGASRHLFATTGGVFVCSAKTITLTGTPAFSSATIIASRTGVFNLPGNTYSGAATGTRYIISYNAVADVAGGGASYIPGNAAGSTSSGGQYA